MLTTESGNLSIEMLAAQGPVGTRGGVEWMRRPCACPGWGATFVLHAVPTGARCHQDKHKAQYISLKAKRGKDKTRKLQSGILPESNKKNSRSFRCTDYAKWKSMTRCVNR